MSPKIILRAAIAGLCLEALGGIIALSVTGGLPDYVAAMIALAGLLVGLISVPIGMYYHHKNHDRIALFTMLLGLGSLLFPIVAWTLFLVIGLHGLQ